MTSAAIIFQPKLTLILTTNLYRVLDALATKLASFAVAEGLVIPGAEVIAQRDGLYEFFPLAAPSSADLSVVLDAISVIIADSKFRSSQLLFSPSILAVFPSVAGTEFIANQNARAAWSAFTTAGLGTRETQLNAIDFLLPCIPLNQPKSATQASAFPPLGTSGSRDNLSQTARKYNGTSLPNWTDSTSFEKGTAASESSTFDSEEPESPLIAYLILLLRSRPLHSRDSMERLMAASVLTVLYRAGLTSKTRETAIGLLVVPLLVEMLEDIIPPPASKDFAADMESSLQDWTVKERAPAILAMLITDSEYLQKAAYDAGVVNKLSKMLKTSYDPVPKRSQVDSWSPDVAGSPDEMVVSQPSEFNSLGSPPLLVHKMKVRESSLKAIAALVPFKDEYRKAIVDQGMIPYIVESMSPNPGKPTPKTGEKVENSTNGGMEPLPDGFGKNSANVLIAACGAIRALSRSVSILRTTLIDNGVAIPVFKLLKHQDVEIQIAATATVCNLVTDISPMRDVNSPYICCIVYRN